MRERTTHHAPIAAAARENAASPHLVRPRRLPGMLWLARGELIGIALLLAGAVGIPAAIAVFAVFAGYATTSVLIVALAAAWGPFVTAVACAIHAAGRFDLPPTPPGSD
jgi:hypothetical protein